MPLIVYLILNSVPVMKSKIAINGATTEHCAPWQLKTVISDHQNKLKALPL